MQSIAANTSFKMPEDGVLLSISASADASNGNIYVTTTGDVVEPTGGSTLGKPALLYAGGGIAAGFIHTSADFGTGIPLSKGQTILASNNCSLQMLFK